MSGVKEAIEEIVEEAYLLGLPEEEIRQSFARFIDTCDAVVRAHVRDRAAASGLTADLAREKALLLIADRAQAARGGAAVAAGAPAPAPAPEAAEGLSELVARRKRTVLKTLGEVDPRLVRLIDERRFQAAGAPARRRRRRLVDWRRAWERHRLQVLRAGYAATVLLIALLIYMGFAQGH